MIYAITLNGTRVLLPSLAQAATPSYATCEIHITESLEVSDTTVIANALLVIEISGGLVIASGKTLTINCPFSGDLAQLSGAGTIVYGALFEHVQGPRADYALLAGSAMTSGSYNGLTPTVTSGNVALAGGGVTLTLTADATISGTPATLGANTFSGSQNTSQATVASHATTADIWGAAGNQILWTGTETTTAFPNAPQAGAERVLFCMEACSFTASATMLIDGVGSGSTVTCAANDEVRVLAISTTQFKLSRKKYDGTAQVATSPSVIVSYLSNLVADSVTGITYVLGNITVVTHASGIVEEYTYSSGNISTIEYTDTDGTTVLYTKTYTYNVGGTIASWAWS